MNRIKLQKIFMPDYQTFSLTTILNKHQLHPEIYNHILHQIKSPLQQQSFELTNDNSLSLDRIPKRPNIPPPPVKSPFTKFEHQQFSRTYDSMQMDLQHSRKVDNQAAKDQKAQSLFSPLDYEVNVKPQPFFNFCGAALDQILKVEDQSQILLPCRSKQFRRKPIFVKNKPNKSLKTVAQALHALKQINQPELAFFLEMMSSLQRQFSKLFEDKAHMQSELSLIYQELSHQSQYLPQTIQANQAYTKILRRLKSRNSGEIVQKLFTRKNKMNTKIAEKNLQHLFLGLAQIQQTINHYLKQQSSLQRLKVAFDFLQHNFHNEQSFELQLQKLYSSLSVGISTQGIQLIWDLCGRRKLLKSQFIEGLSLNSYVVREAQDFESDLISKGFIRNQR